MQTSLQFFLICAASALVSAASGQNHQTFPNVSGVFDHVHACINSQGEWYNMYESYMYQAEPLTEHAGKLWGALNGDPIGIAVEGSKVYLFTDNDFLIDLYGDNILLLYDFALAIGDTAFINYYYAWEGSPALVTAMDTVAIDGRERRRMFISDEFQNEDIWLEGIGSIRGLMRPLWQTPLGCIDPSYEYCANYIDEDGIPYTWCTDLVMSIDQEGQRTVIKVYPNPASSTVTIERPGLDPGSYRLLDLNGRTVSEGMVSQVTMIDLANVLSGLYFLHMDAKVVKLVVE